MSFSFVNTTTTASGTNFNTNTMTAGSLFGGGDNKPFQSPSGDNKTNLFGAPTTSAQPTFGGFSFGPKTTAATSNLFASSTTTASSPFGASKPLTFGGFTAPPNQTVGSPGFGQAPPNQIVGSPAFGQGPPNQTVGSPAFGQSASNQTVGSTAFGQAPPNQTVGSPAFGQSAPNQNVGSSAFGQSAANQTMGSSAFGQTTAQNAPQNLSFGQVTQQQQQTTAAPTFANATQGTLGSTAGSGFSFSKSSSGFSFTPTSVFTMPTSQAATTAQTTQSSFSLTPASTAASLGQSAPAFSQMFAKSTFSLTPSSTTVTTTAATSTAASSFATQSSSSFGLGQQTNFSSQPTTTTATGFSFGQSQATPSFSTSQPQASKAPLSFSTQPPTSTQATSLNIPMPTTTSQAVVTQATAVTSTQAPKLNFGVTWDVRNLLEVFSREYSHKDFCLAHLFTDLKFEGGILGLAYVGSPRRNSVGGICTPEYFKNGYTLYLNSGLSSSRNHYGQRVITREADLVTAHEFGHNWGSEHDPDVVECSPTASQGGSYLMYTYSVSGYDVNNKRFSPCSLRSIRKVLQAKSGRCFSEPEESFCGNLRVEGGEECDAGLLGTEDNDMCCDKNCKLRKNQGAVCSDKNSPCCAGCVFAAAGAVCREPAHAACEGEATCTGASADCPKAPAIADEHECAERGRCRNGTCVPYCETQGMHSCMCDIVADACKRCCRKSLNKTCFPVAHNDILPDGTPCIQGFCNKGVCEKTIQDVVERIWNIIEDININNVLGFLRDNIVGVAALGTALLWIPASCLISYVDRRRQRQHLKYLEWERHHDLVHPSSPRKIIHTRLPKQKATGLKTVIQGTSQL